MYYKLLQKRLATHCTMELKEKYTNSDVQSFLGMSKLHVPQNVNNDFRTFHFVIVDQLDDDEEAETQQEVFDDHDHRAD